MRNRTNESHPALDFHALVKHFLRVCQDHVSQMNSGYHSFDVVRYPHIHARFLQTGNRALKRTNK